MSTTEQEISNAKAVGRKIAAIKAELAQAEKEAHISRRNVLVELQKENRLLQAAGNNFLIPVMFVTHVHYFKHRG